MLSRPAPAGPPASRGDRGRPSCRVLPFGYHVTMSAEPLVVHSLTEASLYLMLARCRDCGDSVIPESVPTGPDPSGGLTVPVVCRSCGREDSVSFDISGMDPAEAAVGLAGWSALAEAGQAPPVNPTDSPSQVIDVAGWLNLHTMLSATARSKMEQATSSADRMVARQLQIQAGQCLEEALKFYDAENELPPDDAFFTEAGREQFREHPEVFLRGRIVSLKAQSASRSKWTDK